MNIFKKSKLILFDNVKVGNRFTLHDEFGKVELLKIEPCKCGNSLCITTQDGTYNRCKVYFTQLDKKVYIYE